MPALPVGGSIVRCGERHREEPVTGASGGSWCCGGAPRPASPGWPGTAVSPGCFTSIHPFDFPFSFVGKWFLEWVCFELRYDELMIRGGSTVPYVRT